MKKNIFIEKAVAIFGNKYDYSLLPEEVSTKKKYDFICPIHGIFHQKAGNHIGSYILFSTSKIPGSLTIQKRRLYQNGYSLLFCIQLIVLIPSFHWRNIERI